MIAAVGGEDLVATGKQSGCANRVLIGVGTAVGEEHLAERGSCFFQHPLGRFTADQYRVLGCDGSECFRLVFNGLDHFGVRVANVGVDQLAREIKKALAVVVEDFAPARPRNNQRVQSSLCGP